MKIGVLGGTFDPPHYGHLKIAEEAIAKLGLAEVMFAPAGQPPHKQGQKVSPVARRVEMVRLAIASDARFVLSRVDSEGEGPSYTVDLIRRLRQSLPGDVEIFFIMGMDSLASILTWREPAELIRLCRLAVFERPGFTADWFVLEKQLPGIRERVTLLNAAVSDISATEIQRRARAGESIAELVPESVAAYVRRERLYT